MTVRAITRSAVDSYLKLVRLPLGTAIGLLPGNGAGPRPAVELMLDRTDATVRGIIARVLGDSKLGEDATRRRAAADAREQALKLHLEAERTAERGDDRLEERQGRAGRQRQQARQRADNKREDAERERETEIRHAAEVRNERLQNSHQATERAERAVDERAAKERLEALDAKSGALRERERELKVRDEAARLREAAGRAKAERKSP
jgi:hypothetical protein